MLLGEDRTGATAFDTVGATTLTRSRGTIDDMAIGRSRWPGRRPINSAFTICPGISGSGVRIRFLQTWKQFLQTARRTPAPAMNAYYAAVAFTTGRCTARFQSVTRLPRTSMMDASGFASSWPNREFLRAWRETITEADTRISVARAAGVLYDSLEAEQWRQVARDFRSEDRDGRSAHCSSHAIDVYLSAFSARSRDGRSFDLGMWRRGRDMWSRHARAGASCGFE